MKPASVEVNPYEAPKTSHLGDGIPAQGRGLLWLLFSFQGRIGRLQYWVGGVAAYVLVLFMVGGLMAVLSSTAGSPVWGSVSESGAMLSGILISYAILAVPLTWIALALLCKRWHDRNRSGWFTLLYFIPYLGALWILIECGLLRGTRGPNRFGPDPVGVLGAFG